MYKSSGLIRPHFQSIPNVRERERERERERTYKKPGPLKNLANTVHLPMAKKSVNNASKQ